MCRHLYEVEQVMQEEFATIRGRKRRRVLVVKKSNPTVLDLYWQSADAYFHRRYLMNVMETIILPVVYSGLQKGNNIDTTVQN